MLEKIENPSDLKALPLSELPAVAAEIRELIIDTVAKNGGHLSSNLGAVELAVSLHYNFNSPDDRIIWDVGHQSYAHKILTDRRARFSTLRRFGGISGFSRPGESPHDAFISGHSGTSVSAALGFAESNRMRGKNNYSVAVVGDGSFTNGMIYEALNNANKKNLKLIIIINDNEMSISKNVGAMPKYFLRIRVSKKYLIIKHKIAAFFVPIPFLYRFFKGVKNLMRRIILSENLFEYLGFDYIGPVNGNDLNSLDYILKSAKRAENSVVVHTYTKKGLGYEFAESQPDIYHSVGSFERDSGVVSNGKTCFSEVFGEIITKKAETDQNICAVTAAMADGTGLNDFKKRFPDRFFDVGIAEEHAMTFSCALALSGKRPVYAVYSTFAQRCFDQIIHDCSMQRLPVILALDRAGVVCADGETHHGLFDVPFLISLPNCAVYSPESYADMRYSIDRAFESDLMTAVRYPRGGEAVYDRSGFTDFGDYSVYSPTDYCDKCIITYGRITAECYAAVLAEGGTKIIRLLKIYPFDIDTIIENLSGVKKILFVEESMKSALSEAICASLAENGALANRQVTIKSIADFVPHGDDESIMELLGLTAVQIRELLK